MLYLAWCSLVGFSLVLYSMHFAYISVNLCYAPPSSTKVKLLQPESILLATRWLLGHTSSAPWHGRFTFPKTEKSELRTASTSIPSIDFFLGTNSFGLGKGKGDGFLVFSSSSSWAQLETKTTTSNGLYVSSMELPLMGFLDGVATKCVIP